MENLETYQLLVTGIVQGVGFRPFVYRLAAELQLKGYVCNTSQGVRIVVQAQAAELALFQAQLRARAPAQAQIDTLQVQVAAEAEVFSFFEIRPSEDSAVKSPRISPDLPVCNACLSELLNPQDRRYYYPYINCTHCGPRYTIISGVPYDRPSTTMAGFQMCPLCEAEYHDPADRRFHAQPNACHECGPRLWLCDNQGRCLLEPRTPAGYQAFFQRIGHLLTEGGILAIKGIGGFHLACRADDEKAVWNLRQRKYRECKPFAMMCRDLQQAGHYTVLSPREQGLLLSLARPIVLAMKNNGAAELAEAIAPGNRCLGIMLPYTPLHRLLFEHVPFPLVMTSANVAEEPIAYENSGALSCLQELCDYFILGSRDIFIRCDDSVTRCSSGEAYVLRRSRGYVPLPVILEKPLTMSVLALGAEQKNTVCLGRDTLALLSHHTGDLKNLQALEAFKQSLQQLCRVMALQPERIACDLHPAYLNTRFIRELPAAFSWLAGIPVTGVQHHHAHVAACMADNGLGPPLIGIALDGSGYGSDGTIWGGEIFTVEDWHFTRRVSLYPVSLPGGDLAIKKPWLMAAAYLAELFGDDWPAHTPLSWQELPQQELAVAGFQLKQRSRFVRTSSCGRLFDAVSALAGIRLQAFYEGQAAVELEQSIRGVSQFVYPLQLQPSGSGYDWILWQDLLRAVLADVNNHCPAGEIANRFHAGLVDILVKACYHLRQQTGLTRVVLSGGCFMNMVLLKRLSAGLRAGGFSVYTHRQVPCNDGGIALGQVVLAACHKGEV